MKKRLLLALTAVFLMLFALSSCDSGISVVSVTDIKLNSTTEENITLIAGGTLTLTATVIPSDATDQSITWKTSDASIATVDDNGVVTAVSEGTVTITATANGGEGISDSCKITVSPFEITGELTLAMDEATGYKTSVQLKIAGLSGEEATKVTWTSSNKAVVTVTENGGLVTAVGDGTAIITATYNGVKATCTITVLADYFPGME